MNEKKLDYRHCEECDHCVMQAALTCSLDGECVTRMQDACAMFEDSQNPCDTCHYFGGEKDTEGRGWCYLCNDETYSDTPSCREWEQRTII